MQAVLGVDCIYKYRNFLECFYQSVPSKNGLLLSPPQDFQISRCIVHILPSGKLTKGWNFKQGFFLFGFLLLLLLFGWFFNL